MVKAFLGIAILSEIALLVYCLVRKAAPVWKHASGVWLRQPQLPSIIFSPPTQ